MRILLINPPRSPHNALYDHAPAEARPFVHRRLVGPPLGLLTLAAAVPDHEVSVLDMKGEYDLHPQAPPPEELTKLWLREVKPDLVGVTFIASEFPAGMAVLKTVKEADPAIATIAGGLHAGLCPEDFRHPAVDMIAVGPAVKSFPLLASAMASGKRPEGIAGILFRGADGSYNGIPETGLSPADADFIRPDRSYLKPWLPAYVVGRALGPSTYLFTSLGCPFRCSFCSIWPQYGGKYMQRDVESVIAELKTLDEYPVVRFADANTLVNLDFAKRLFRRIAEEGIKKTLIMDIRVDTAADHPELIAVLAKGGLAVVISGFESPRESELREYGKSQPATAIETAIKVFHDNGIMLRGNYIVRPDYDEADFEALAAYADKHRVAFAGYTILTPMPGTPYHLRVNDQITDRDLGKYNFFNCVLRTKMPLERFYGLTGDLWRIRMGTETI